MIPLEIKRTILFCSRDYPRCSFNSCVVLTSHVEMAEETSNTVMEATELRSSTATFYGWKYKHYFVVVEKNEKNLKARCTLCAPSKKPLSTAHNTTSNFKKHLQTVQKTTKLVESCPTNDQGKGSKKRGRDSGDICERGSKNDSAH